MTKCQPKTLTPFIDGEVSDELREQVAEHLRSCPSCSALVDELTSARDRVQEMGRARIPNSLLLPALEVVGERNGLETRLEAPAPSLSVYDQRATPAEDDGAEAEPIAEQEPELEAEPVGQAEPELQAEPEVEPQALVEAEPELEAEPSAEAEPMVEDEPELEDEAPRTWVNPEAMPPAAEVVAPEPVAEPEPEPEMVDASAEAPAVSEAATSDAQELGGHLPGAYADHEMPQMAPFAEAIDLQQHPDAPPAELRPPWLADDAIDDATLLEEGRRAVDDGLAEPAEGDSTEQEKVAEAPPVPEPEPWAVAAQAPEAEAEAQPVPVEAHAPEPELEPEPVSVETHAPEPELEPEPALVPVEALASEPELEPEAEEAAATESEPERLTYEVAAADASDPAADTAPLMSDYRREILGREAEAAPTPRPLPLGLGAFSTRVKAGLAAAAALVLVIAVALVVLPKGSHPQSTATHPTPRSTTRPTAAPSAVPSPVPTSGPGGLTNIASAGSGGTGFRVKTIRSGSPNGAFTRIVFDLDGAGPTPNAQLGRGTDGADYLVSPGITIDAAALGSFTPYGPITALSRAGSTGLNLRIATSGNPEYSIGYLLNPFRLVLDFK